VTSDIIICKSPRDTSSYWAKRVIAQAGEYVRKDPNDPKSSFQIPEGHIWLQGDNLAQSIDCRQYGPVRYDQVKGKVIASVVPFGNIQRLKPTLKYRGY